MDSPSLLWLSFLAGIYAPLGSPCVVVLYPGYLSFLAGTADRREARVRPFVLGLAVASGVILSLLLGGSLFGLVVQAFGPAARVLLQPVTSVLLLAFSLALILDIPVLPPGRAVHLPGGSTPYSAAFLLGFFLGIIILPCNAAIILVLLTLASSVATALEAAGLFLAFGAGMVLPLLVLAGIPPSRSRQVQGFLARHQLAVQRAAGLVMLAVAVYSLVLFSLPGISGFPLQ